PDRIRRPLRGTERAQRSAGRAPGRGDGRRRSVRYVEARQLPCQIGWDRGERLGLRVVRQLATGELLRDDGATVRLVLGRHAERSRRAAEFVPRGVDWPANHPGAGVGGPEDDGLVGGAERGVAAIRSASGPLINGGKTEVTVGRPAKRLVFLQDQAGHDVGTGGGGEEDLAAGEVLAEPLTYCVDPAVLGPERTGIAAAGVPIRGDRRVGV